VFAQGTLPERGWASPCSPTRQRRGRPRRRDRPARGLDPREYTTSAGEKRLALEVHDVAIEYGPKPRAAEPDSLAMVKPATQPAEDDIPF
jgi:hypothetical protein